MDPILSVTTAATDLTLLTIAERRAAVGLTDNSKDPELKTLEERVAARIAHVCNVATAGTTPPTLREETLTETFRLDGLSRGPHELVLARLPIVSVTSVVEDGTTLVAADYEILSAAGLLRRLSSGNPDRWETAKITVVYKAGWATVPAGLKLAAERLMRNYWYDGSRDPAVRSVEIPGVRTVNYWVGASSDPDIPAEILDLLQPFINPAFA